MANFTLQQRLRYGFDNFMARGGSSIFIALITVFLTIFILVSVLRTSVALLVPQEANTRYSHPADESQPKSVENKTVGYGNNVYVGLLTMLAAGNMNIDLESHWLYKLCTLLGGFTGVGLLSSLVAFITTAVHGKINQLKKGHSTVVETEHSLLLGWNERVVEIIRELVIANESEKNPVVVILADRDKVEMDDFLKLNLPDTQNTKIVTRSGSPTNLKNLDIVSVNHCKSIIVLATCNYASPREERLASDAATIKSVLAITAARDSDTELNIVAEIFDEKNREIIEAISPDEITTIDTNEILAKILVQTSRSVGLSVVYGEILSFDGCEMYFHEEDWGGILWGELAFHFPDGIPMGIRRADGELLLNPDVTETVHNGDSILILAEDDSTIEFVPKPVASAREFELAGGRKQMSVENNLLIGWTAKSATILREYADYVLEGSKISIMLRAPRPELAGQIEELNKELASIDIQLIDNDPMTTEGLIAVNPFGFDNIIILSQGASEDFINEERTDSETIVILLLLRQIFKQNPEHAAKVKLITEILDSDVQSLVARTGVNDFIISNRFVSMVLAQISEDPDIERVYDDIFSEDGSEIYLKPASLYFNEFPVEVSYADMIRIAQKREEVCLGVKQKAFEQDMDRNFGVKLIPEKNVRYTLNADDALVVLSEDET